MRHFHTSSRIHHTAGPHIFHYWNTVTYAKIINVTLSNQTAFSIKAKHQLLLCTKKKVNVLHGLEHPCYCDNGKVLRTVVLTLLLSSYFCLVLVLQLTVWNQHRHAQFQNFAHDFLSEAAENPIETYSFMWKLQQYATKYQQVMKTAHMVIWEDNM